MSATGIRERRRVRVWFGEHVIVNKTADEAFANRFAEAMERRFSSLRVTNEPISAIPPREEQSAPSALSFPSTSSVDRGEPR